MQLWTWFWEILKIRNKILHYHWLSFFLRKILWSIFDKIPSLKVTLPKQRENFQLTSIHKIDNNAYILLSF